MAFVHGSDIFESQMDSAMNNNSNLLVLKNSTEFWETAAAYYIGVYGMFVIAFVGLIGNTLAFLVFGRLKPQSGTTLYLQALAVSDMVSLSWDSIVSTALPLMGFKTESSSYWACKLGIWHDMSSSVVASCALLVVAVDRYIFLKFNTFHKKYCTRKLAISINVLLWMVTYAYCSPLIYFYEYTDSHCSLSKDSFKLDAGLKFVTFITYGPYFAIPVVGIIASNISIVNMLHVRKKKRKRIGKLTNVSDEVSWLLVIDCLAFTVLIGVVAVLWALAWRPAQNAYQQATFQLMFVLAQFISCIEECIDFFLYIICSKTFRCTLLSMFGLSTAIRCRQTRTNEDQVYLSGIINLKLKQKRPQTIGRAEFKKKNANLFDHWVGISFSISQIRDSDDYL